MKGQFVTNATGTPQTNTNPKPTTTRAAGTDEWYSDGYINFENPLASPLSIDVTENRTNFQTWIIINNPARWKTAWAKLDWGSVKVSEDGKRILLSVDNRKLDFHWLGFGDDPNVNAESARILPGDQWYVCAVMGGGRMTYAKDKKFVNVRNGNDPGNVAFVLDFDNLNYNKWGLQVPYVTKWTPVKVEQMNGDNHLKFNLDFHLAGNILRANIEQDATKSERTSLVSPQYDYEKNEDYHKIILFESNAFYKPIFVFPYQCQPDAEITTAQYDGGKQELNQKLIPNHPAQDLTQNDNVMNFLTWAMPVKLKDERKEGEQFYTKFELSNGGMVIASSKNHYIGPYTFTSLPSRQGTVFNFGELKEVFPRVTPEMAQEYGLPNDKIMQYPVPLEALAEYNLGQASGQWATSSTKLSAQGRWEWYDFNSKNEEDHYNLYIYKNIPRTDPGSDQPAYPRWRGSTSTDYAYAFPYIDNEQGNEHKFSDTKWLNKEVTEWLTLGMDIRQTEEISKRIADETKCKYFAEKVNGQPNYTIYAIRFMNGNSTGNSHKCAYRYDFSHMPEPYYKDIENGVKDECYIQIRARYIGDAPVTEAMVKDERWWDKPMPSEIVRNFTMCGDVNKRGLDLEHGQANHNKFIWYQRAWASGERIETKAYYLTLSKTIDAYGTRPAYRNFYSNWMFHRDQGASTWGSLFRPVRDFTRL